MTTQAGDPFVEAGWVKRPDGSYEVPPSTHVYEWGLWSEWYPRPGHEHHHEWQRTRVCLNGCGVDEVQTDYRPEES